MAIGSVQFGGLASGLPPDLVDQLMQGKQARLESYKRDQTWFSDQKKSYAELQTKLTSLSSKAVALQDVTAWAPHTTTSSDSDKITATASNSATASIHTLSVSQLATHDTHILGDDSMTAGSGVSSSTDTLVDSGTTASNITFTYNGTTYGTGAATTTAGFSAAELSGKSLSDIASAINGIDYGTEEGVSASVLYDGSRYRLVLTANDSGQNSGAARISVDNTTSLTFTTAGTLSSFKNTVAGHDASFNIDGVDATSTSNSVTEVLTGVTLQLKSVTTTGVSITVADDTDALKNTLNSFVESYNAVIDYIGSNKDGLLSGSSLARSVISQLRSVLNTRTSRSDGSGGHLSPYSTLSELGLRTDAKSGKISFNGASLDAAISSDFNVITSMFTNTQADVGTGNNAGIAHRFETLIRSMTNSSSGALTNQSSGLQTRIDRLSKDIERENTRLEKVRQQLTLKFSNLEQMVSKLNSAGAAMNSALSRL